ncbi:VWA domain-containing protein [Tessaracoccus sp. OH4464_COT-324]|uniref:vWA domain-containing protein n=1 Tax=Tessaracoccus sp. OH4464_COT-324 TaxID=2491059 RepID=UPI000F62DBC8|nr:VWA domain-containing protein [Tessaracoccus sp. OH4464_COT-324]RRD45231.1 VWA domain-containing protein [Tessaracoccus sp. OH4464_COT-324]
MALTFPLAGLAVLLVAALVVLLGFVLPRRRPSERDAVRYAAARRLRALPRFAELARRERRWRRVELACVVLAVLGLALLVSRPVVSDTWEEERRNRDIMLCLDVSGSMTNVDADVLRAFEGLAGTLSGERIGLSLFDSSAVTLFPLTDDAAYVQEQLRAARDELDRGPVVGTRVGQSGTSLIADGLMGCLDRFDHRDSTRSRTVVLATDNQTAGRPLYSFDEAIARARRDGVVVFAVVPVDNSVSATDALSASVRQTGGGSLLLGPKADVAEITRAVERTQAMALPRSPRPHPRELVWPGLALALAGLAGVAFASGRRRRW